MGLGEVKEAGQEVEGKAEGLEGGSGVEREVGWEVGRAEG